MSLQGLEDLRTRFRQRSIDDIAAIRLWVGSGCPVDRVVERTIHNLAGAGGTLGFADLHAAASVIDDALAVGETPSKADVEALLDQIERLRAA